MSRKPLSEKEYKNIRKLLKRDKKKKGSKNSRVAKLTNRSAETVRVVGKFDTYKGYVNRKNTKKVGSVGVKYVKPANTKDLDVEFKEFKKLTAGNLIEHHDLINNLGENTRKEFILVRQSLRLYKEDAVKTRNRSFVNEFEAKKATRLATLSMGLLIFYVVASWFISLN